MEPKIGKYYYHYKHDPNGPVNKYAYEIINFGHHTEIDGLEESKMVAYAPLYEDAGVYRAGRHWDLRPIKMFTELVHKDGKSFERFTEIIDERIISELDKIKKELYG